MPVAAVEAYWWQVMQDMLGFCRKVSSTALTKVGVLGCPSGSGTDFGAGRVAT